MIYKNSLKIKNKVDPSSNNKPTKANNAHTKKCKIPYLK